MCWISYNLDILWFLDIWKRSLQRCYYLKQGDLGAWEYPHIYDNAQCADSEVRNAIERTPYIVVLKFHVFILISKSFNFRSPLDRILRYLTKTWFYTLNFKIISCWWLSIAYWVIENDSVSDKKEHIFVGPLELKILSSLKQMTLTKYNWMPLLFGTH